MTLTNLPDRATATPATLPTRSQPGAFISEDSYEYAPEASRPRGEDSPLTLPNFKLCCLGALVVIGALAWVDVKRIEHFSALEVQSD